MTSYRSFKMAAVEWKMYFRVDIWGRYLFKKVEMYLHAKFRRDISIPSEIRLLPVFKNLAAAILEFYFRFRFRPTLILLTLTVTVRVTLTLLTLLTLILDTVVNKAPTSAG